MSKTNQSAKTEKNVIASKKDANLIAINLDAFASQLDEIKDLRERKSKKESIYKYPEDFPKNEINTEKGKNWRNNKRGSIKRFVNNILLFAKMKRMEDLQKEIIAFKEFYKSFYILNDYSLQSISNSNKDKEGKDLELCLSIVKQTI